MGGHPALLRALIVASALLAACAGRKHEAVATQDVLGRTPRPLEWIQPYSLRTRGADAQSLIGFVSRLKGRTVVVGAEVEGTLDLDLERDSLLQLADEVVRASGAGSLVFGNTVLVGGPARLASASGHPLRPLLMDGEYNGRRVTLYFTRYRLTNLLRLLAGVSNRSFEVAEGVEEWVSISASEVPWTRILDALLVAGDLSSRDADGMIRVSRRGDGSPRFSPLGRDLVDVSYDPRAPPKERDGRCAPPLGDSDLSQLRLLAVMTGPAKPERFVRLPEALVRLPNGKPFDVGGNTCIGSAGGRVFRVERDRIVVRESQLRADGTRDVVERVLALDGE